MTVSGLCHCGCGEVTGVYTATRSERGVTKGDHRRYINGHGGVMNRKPGPEYLVEDRGFETACWIWQKTLDPMGYGRMWDRDSGRGQLAHRMYWKHARGTTPNTLDHLCRNPSCVNPDHLEPVTRQENVRRGVRAKLNWEAVRIIRGSGLHTLTLAQRFGVSGATIINVRAGRAWPERHAPWNQEVAA